MPLGYADSTDNPLGATTRTSFHETRTLPVCFNNKTTAGTALPLRNRLRNAVSDNVSAVYEVPELTAGQRRDFHAHLKLPFSLAAWQGREAAAA